MLDSREYSDVTNYVKALFKREGLVGWTFKLNARFTRVLGRCNYTTKTIEISKQHVNFDSLEDVTDTILHEIAHANVGAGYGHDETWQREAIRIGARPVSKKSVKKVIIDTLEEFIHVLMFNGDIIRVLKNTEIKKYSKPNALDNMYLTGRKSTTYGKIQYRKLSTDEYNMRVNK